MARNGSSKQRCTSSWHNLRANEEIEHMNIEPWTFYVCDVFQNLRKSSFDFFVARNEFSEHGFGGGFGALIEKLWIFSWPEMGLLSTVLAR